MRVISIDQGTTGTKAHSLDEDGIFQTIFHREHQQIYPKPQWVEHDPLELLKNVTDCIRHADQGAILALANQGETIMAWDSQTKRPIYNAIVWQDARTNDFIEKLKADGRETEVLEKAGLPLDCYFSASKFRWILDHVDEAKILLREKRLRMGTSDAFFLDSLTGAFVTDIATASRTSLLNIKTGNWDEGLCTLFGVPMETLPKIGPSAGEIAVLPDGKIFGSSIVDQQAALYGHGCRKMGDSKITFGTGAFALTLAGEKMIADPKSGILPTIAWKIREEPTLYALDGGVYNAASAVNWARQLGLFSEYHEIDPFAAQSALERGLVFVPALSGLGSPYWDRSAAGMWLGLSLETNRTDMMLALLEGVALRAREVILAQHQLISSAGNISIDGGMTKNQYFTQFLADILNQEIILPSTSELTGLGAAMLAFAGQGKTPPTPSAPKTIIHPVAPIASSHLAKFSDAITRSRRWRN